MTLALNIENRFECATLPYIRVNLLAGSYENKTIHYKVCSKTSGFELLAFGY